MDIKLTPEEKQIVLQVAQDMAKTKGVTEEQALKDLLAMGVNTWREMQHLAKLHSN